MSVSINAELAGTGSSLLTSTWANKPLATAYVGRLFISDIGGGSIWISNGTRWYPENGRVTLFKLGATTTARTYNPEAIVTECTYLIPAGLWQIYDSLRVTATALKSGTTDVAGVQWRCGINNTTADVNLSGTTTSSFNAATNGMGAEVEFKRMADTSARKMGNLTIPHGYSAGAAGGLQPAQTVPGVNTAAYLNFTIAYSSGAGSETYQIYDYCVELISAQ